MGFPIRKSTDQRVFAPPRSLSQRITSFIACACQGIHQLPLRHLIVLIANAHRAIPKGLSRQAQSRRDCRHRTTLAGCLMPSAQKDQLLEIGSRVRLGKPIICGRLSVSPRQTNFQRHDPCPKSLATFWGHVRPLEFEQIFSLRCQTEQATSSKATSQTLLANDCCFHPLNTR